MRLDIPRSAVCSVAFLDTPDAPQDAVDCSEARDGSVLAWARHNGEYYNVYVAADGGVIANANSSSLFYGYSNLTAIQFNGCFDAGNITTAVSMFENCERLTELDLSGLDLSRVTDAAYMFRSCSSLKPPRMGNFNFDSVDAYEMFSDKILICSECSAEFIFSGEDREFYAQKGFQNEPGRCPECREERRTQTSVTAAPKRALVDYPCSGCSKITQFPFTPKGDRPVYCNDCWNALRS